MKNYRFFLGNKILIILQIVLLVLLSSCSGTGRQKNLTDKTREDFSNIKQEAKAEQEKNKQLSFFIGMSQCSFAEPWRAEMNDQLKAAATKHPEFKLVISDGRQDNNKQNSDIESFIQKGVDLLMVSPNEAEPLTEVIKKAYDSGIPVILIDRRIKGDSYTQYIGADNILIGQKCGEWVANYLGPQGGNIVEIMGSIGTSAQKERHEGFLDGLSINPNARIIASQSSDWLRDKAIDAMDQMLKEHEKIDVVFSHNDPGAEGAYTSAKNAGREHEMKFVGIDALPTPDGGIMSVLEGRISVTYQYPTGAKEAVESAYKLLVKGEKLQRHIKLDTIEITKENALQVYIN